MSCAIHTTQAAGAPIFGKSQRVAPNENANASTTTWTGSERKTSDAPDHKNFMAHEEISDFQREKIAELRRAIGAPLMARTPIFDDDFSMLRWLIANNYKIAESSSGKKAEAAAKYISSVLEDIVPKFEKASQILTAMNIMNIVIDNVDQLNAYMSTVTIAAPYYPGGIMGLDVEGNCISMQMSGMSHPKSLSLCGRISDIYRLSFTETALVHQLIRLQEKKTGRKLGLRIIIDLEGFNTDHITSAGLKAYCNTLKYLQNIFPDITRQVYVINAPVMVTAAYKIIKAVLSEQSRQKVVFLGSSYQETLVNEIGADYLYERWGGRLRPAHGHPETGLIRVGGAPPLAIKYCPSKNSEYVDESALTVLSVPARARREVNVEVAKPGQHIHWYFYTSNDIDFGIFDPDGVEVWPIFRITTDSVPEFSKIVCQKTGTYTVVFNNSFSVFFSKEVRYHVHAK